MILRKIHNEESQMITSILAIVGFLFGSIFAQLMLEKYGLAKALAAVIGFHGVAFIVCYLTFGWPL